MWQSGTWACWGFFACVAQMQELHKCIFKGRCFGKSNHVLEPQHLLECIEVGVTGYYGIIVVRFLEQDKQTVTLRDGGEKSKEPVTSEKSLLA